MGTPRAGGGEPAGRGSPGCPSPGPGAAFRRKRKQCQGASGARWGGRGAPPPAVSETRVHHWLYRSKFSAGGAQGTGARAEGEGRGGARPTGLRRRHLFVVLKPGALSSAQLTHNGQLFLAEGAAGAHPHGWSSWRVPISPFRHRHPSWGRSGGTWGAFLLFPGSWPQVLRIKSEAGGMAWQGGGRPGEGSLEPGRPCHAEMASKEFGVQAQIAAPLRPPPTAAGIGGC